MFDNLVGESIKDNTTDTWWNSSRYIWADCMVYHIFLTNVNETVNLAPTVPHHLPPGSSLILIISYSPVSF